MRTAKVTRTTKETDISLSLSLDGTGKAQISTGVGFFDHMLELLTVHSRMDVTLTCKGDLQVDAHHTVEDVGIALGDCVKTALGDKRGIARFADRLVPMDEVAAQVAIDFSGRPCLIFEDTLTGKVGNFDMELVEEFLRAFTTHAGVQPVCAHSSHGKQTPHGGGDFQGARAVRARCGEGRFGQCTFLQGDA